MIENVVAISVERTALDMGNGVITVYLAGHNNPCTRAGALFVKRIASSGGCAVNQNSPRYSHLGVAVRVNAPPLTFSVVPSSLLTTFRPPA